MNNKKYTQKEMYLLIRTWEFEVEEGFWDYNENIINPYQLCFWLYGKNILNHDQFTYFISQNLLSYEDVFMNNDNYSIYKDKDDSWIYQTWIMADLLRIVPVYIDRMKKSFSEHKVKFKISEKYRNRIEKEIEEIRKDERK